MATPDRNNPFDWNENAVDEVLNMLLGADRADMLQPMNPPANASSSTQAEIDAAAEAAASCSALQSAAAPQFARTSPTGMNLQPDNLSVSRQTSLPYTATTDTSGRRSSEMMSAASAAVSRTQSQLMDDMLSTGNIEGMSWQEFMDGIENQAAVPPAQKRGRKPSANRTSRDRNRKKESSMKIKELEAELETKLSLVTQLEGQNDDLKRKERLLRLSVEACEDNMSKLTNHQFAPSMRELLMSFRNTYNKANAEQILLKVSSIQHPQDMTMDMFRSTWQALIMELADMLMKDSLATAPEAKIETEARLLQIMTQMHKFVSALCVHGSNIIGRAQSTSMLTGEEVTTDVNFWADIADKLALSDEQVKDMLGAWEMFTSALKQNDDERNILKAQLDQEAGKRDEDYSCPGGGAVSESISSVTKKLTANLQRGGIIHTIMASVVLRIMTPRQVAQLCVNSSPLFPNVIAVLQGLAMRSGLEVTRNVVPYTNPAAHGATPFQLGLQKQIP